MTKSSKRPDDFNLMARILRAMAHPARLRILMGLCRQECHVNQMWRRLRISQPLASQHLRRLKQAGLVTAKREGKQICYQVQDVRVKKILRQLKEAFDLDVECQFSKEE